jgi:hypothetical protein
MVRSRFSSSPEASDPSSSALAVEFPLEAVASGAPAPVRYRVRYWPSKADQVPMGIDYASAEAADSHCGAHLGWYRLYS